MITKSVNKNLCNQIATIFCAEQSNPAICKQSLYQRLITDLTDYAFENGFLPNINEGRFYKMRYWNFRVQPGLSKWNVELIDLITNERFEGEWSYPAYPAISKLASTAASHQYIIISQNNTYSAENVTDTRIVWNRFKPGYGIVYVPAGVGGSGGTGTGGGYTPPGGGGQIQKQPPAGP